MGENRVIHGHRWTRSGAIRDKSGPLGRGGRVGVAWALLHRGSDEWQKQKGPHALRTTGGDDEAMAREIFVIGSSDHGRRWADIVARARLHPQERQQVGSLGYVYTEVERRMRMYRRVFRPWMRRLALAGSWDRSVKIWNISKGTLLRTLKGHSDWVTSVAISPDGRLALSGSDDNTVRVWNISDGEPLHTLRGHSADVNAVAFSPDSRRALSGSWDQTVKVWNVSDGELLRSFEGHCADVNAVAFSPDGRLALSGSADTTTRLWDLDTGREVTRSIGFTTGEWITITPEGFFVASSRIADHAYFVVGTTIHKLREHHRAFERPNLVESKVAGTDQDTIARLAQEPSAMSSTCVRRSSCWRDGFGSPGGTHCPRGYTGRGRRCCKEVISKPSWSVALWPMTMRAVCKPFVSVFTVSRVCGWWKPTGFSSVSASGISPT